MTLLRRIAAVCICVLVIGPASADCTVGLQAPAQVNAGQEYDVNIVPATGATVGAFNYILTEAWGERPLISDIQRLRTDRFTKIVTSAPFRGRKTSHLATYDLPVTYRVVATNVNNPADGCSAEVSVLVKADPDLAKLMRRGVVPVVGKTGGLNGSNFKTSLRLTGGGTGRLVFRPLGRPASENDPSIPYDTTQKEGQVQGVQLFDDLMAAFGTTGVGSLDIIPDFPTAFIPRGEARIYNESNGATFGMIEPIMVPAEWFGLDGADELRGLSRDPNPNSFGFSTRAMNTVDSPPLPQGMRLNVGIRSFTLLRLFVLILRADGTTDFGIFGQDPDSLVMGTVEQLYHLPPLGPGDSVSISIGSGLGIPFYTLNDNLTNDPAIAFAPRSGGRIDRYRD